jgi:uncharacterized protein (TIGR02996 family)
MPRYALGDDVWQIVHDGKQLLITSAGKTTTRTFQTADQAATQLERLIADKLAAGYLPALNDPRSGELEAAIAADPDAREPYSVYGDWLESQGDPRGQLVALQLAADGDKKLEAVAAKHLALHAEYFLGSLGELQKAGDDEVLAWRWGFIQKAYLHAERHRPLDATLRRVLGHPSARFLTELALGGNERAQEALDVLADSTLPSLRALRLWSMWQLDLGALWPAMPELRRLALSGQALALGGLELPKLERLDVGDSELSNANARTLATAPWPALQQLRLDFGTGYLTGDASIDDVFALLARADLPRLARLALNHTRYIRELVRELPASPVAAQLELLDLSNNHMTDAHAIALADQRARFPRLQQLDVSANQLTKVGLDALAGFAPKLRALRQEP